MNWRYSHTLCRSLTTTPLRSATAITTNDLTFVFSIAMQQNICLDSAWRWQYYMGYQVQHAFWIVFLMYSGTTFKPTKLLWPRRERRYKRWHMSASIVASSLTSYQLSSNMNEFTQERSRIHASIVKNALANQTTRSIHVICMTILKRVDEHRY